MLHRLRYFIPALLIIMIQLTGCVYEQIEPVKAPENVCWTDEVLPVFVNSCAAISCHNTGGVYPDLSESYAYLNLTQSTLIDTLNPDQSELYLKITVGSMKDLATDVEKAIILSWINGGAKEECEQ